MKVKVVHGTKPGRIEIHVADREPIIIWDEIEARALTITLCESVQRAWPDHYRPVTL